LGRRNATIGIGIIFVYGGYTVVFTPVIFWLSKAAQPLADMGWNGILLYALAFIILATLMVPSSLMKLVAGALFGFTGGVVAGGLGAFFGALVPFFAVRHLGLRRWVEPHLEKPIWKAVDDAVEENGLVLTGLLRLSLILPYNFSNYIWGATQIRTSDYIKGNVLTFVPTILYAWWGAALGDVVEIASGGGPERDSLWWTSMIVSGIITIGSAVWMHQLVNSKVDMILNRSESE